jgi:hypothetical protein
VLDREGTTVMPDWGGALLEGGLYNVGDHGLIEEAEEPVIGLGPYKYSGVPPDGWKNGIAEKGAEAVDILTGDTYRNTGTKAATVWTADAPSGGGSGETVVYSHTATGTESSFGPITLPTDGRHAEVLITAGGSTAGFAFSFVLNGDTDPAHYTGDGVPGAISREFDGIVGNASAVCQVQMLLADYRHVGWHLLPRHTSLMDGNTAFHQKDVGAYLVELALSGLTLLTYANDGVFDPAPLASGSRVEVRIRS